MRTQLRRILLAWPMATSVAVIAITWNGADDLLAKFSARLSGLIESSWASVVVTPLGSGARGEVTADRARAEGSAPLSSSHVDGRLGLAGDSWTVSHPGGPLWSVAGVERSGQGSRAMKLPERLAEVLGDGRDGSASRATLQAPRRQESRELAGLAMRAPGFAADAEADHHRFSVETGDVSAGRGPSSPPAALRRGAGSPPAARVASRGLTRLGHGAALEMSLTAPHPVNAAAARGNATTALLAGLRAAPGPAESRGDASQTRREPHAAAATAAGRLAGLQLATAGGRVRTVAGGNAGPPRRHGIAAELAGGPGGWPRTDALHQQLETLAALAVHVPPRAGARFVSLRSAENEAQRWAGEVAGRLEQLEALSRLGNARAGELIDQLARDAAEGIQAAEQLDDRAEQLQWLRAAHALSRRTAVWRPVWQLARNGNDRGHAPAADRLDSDQCQRLIARVRSGLRQTGDPAGWADYLLLEQIQEAAEGDRYEQRALVAQRLLSRLDWYGLSDQQRRLLSRDSVDRLAEAVRPWAGAPIDYVRLIAQIERRESDAIDLASIEIADAVQALRFAENDRAARVAEAINTHYRNANVRFAISDEMLQRLLPQIEPKAVPVRETVFGSQVRGISRIDSQLRLQLRPSPDRWSLALQTAGNVDTRSVGYRGPVAVRTQGLAEFQASTPIVLTRRGVDLDESQVEVQGRNRLRGIRTDYDGWPLIGPLVRTIAKTQYEELAPRTRGYTERKIRGEVRREIDGRMEKQIDDASDRIRSAVLGPLSELELAPMVVDMETTERRLIARYRLAGDWQMAAFTPRPRAPQSSLMSVQIHQSALNNTLEQLLPRDEPKSIKAMMSDGMELFGRDTAALPDDIPADVMVQFTRTRPITVEVQDGLVWVTMRIVRLSRDDSIDLSRFIVRAAFRPQIDGLNASLIRDGHLRISGPGMSMRERLPVRAIFNKVLSAERPLRLTLPALTDAPAAEDLVVSQLELRDGWIAMAVSQKGAPRIAMGPRQEEKQR